MEDCGAIILSVGKAELEEIMEKRAYEGHLSYPVKAIFDSEYVLVRISEYIVAILGIDEWVRKPGNSNIWRFVFSSAVYDQGKALPVGSHFHNARWITKSQILELEPALSKPELEDLAPEKPPLSLGLKEAAEAIASKFEVSASQVKIQVHN